VYNRRYTSPTEAKIPERISFSTQVRTRNDGQRWRGVLQLRAAACCHVQPRHMFSHACACWIIVAPCTHLLRSCDTDRQAKEICRRTECACTALIASDALATGLQYAHLHTLGVYFFLARSLCLSLSLSLFFPLPSSPTRRGGSQRLVDVHTHCANCEQCTCSRGLVYTLAYAGCLVTKWTHVVSCFMYR